MTGWTRGVSGLAVVVAVLFACGQASTSPVPRAASTPEIAQPGSSQPSQPSAAASAPTAAAQPPGRIAFDRFDSTFGAEAPYLGTAIVNSDGSGERRIRLPSEVVGLTPVWSADGSRLLLLTWDPPAVPAHPAIIGVDGTGYIRLDPAPTLGDLGCDDWSPAGQLLACWVSGFQPDPDGIYTLRPDGSGLTRLTTSPFHLTEGSAGTCGGGDSRGDFSPDGSQIAFIRQRCGAGANPSSDESAAIVIINVDGTGLREIVPQGGVKTHAGSQLSWSPDGSTIALGSQAGDLFLVHPDGTGLTQVPMPASIGSHHAYGPDWSPDGAKLVFSMYIDARNSTDLYSIRPDGSELVQLTDADGAENFASWGPPASPRRSLNPSAEPSRP